MNRMRLFLTLILLPASAIAFDFKGIAIGSPATPEQVLEKLGVKCGAGANEIQVCNGSVTIARESARMNLVINAAGIVQRIDLTLSPLSFDLLAPILIEKYGPPTKTDRSELQNRMGAKFDQVVHFWLDGDAQVLYQKYAGATDSSNLYFSTKEDRDLRSQRTANRRGDI